MLRILYFALFACPLFLLATLLTAFFTVVGCLLGMERVFSYYPGMLWSRLTCFLARCPVRVSGLENISKDESYVFVANHQGAFDVFLIYGYLGVPFKWVMKSGIQRIPFVGKACRTAGFVFVNNATRKSALRSIEEAEACIKNGYSIVIFPEGARTYDGRMQRFKKGAFQIAQEQGVRVVPITINGSFDVLPIGSLNVKSGVLKMNIHPPVDIERAQDPRRNLQLTADKLHAIIASSLDEKYR